MNFLNLIDIYGSTFNFTTFKSGKFNTKLGGLFTLLTLGFSLALFLVFGKPLFYKLNPSVLVQTTDLPSYPQYKLKTNEFPVAFRFENERREILDLSTSLYPYIQYIQQKKNHTTGNMVTYNTTVLNTTACDESKLNSTNLANVLNGWYCIDFSNFMTWNLTLGGLYDNGNDYINYFKVTVFYCKYDGIMYSNCTDYSKINTILNGKVKTYFSMMIPDVAITPQDPARPLTVTATNLFFTLSPLLMRTDRYYYRYVKVNQDVGWFFEEKNDFNGFTMERRDTDIQMRTIEDYNNPNTIKTIATAVFFTNNKINEYQVIFQKIQYVLANTGGIIKLITTVFIILMIIVNEHLRYFYIVAELYDFDVFDKKGKKILKQIGMKDGIVKVRELSSNCLEKSQKFIPECNQQLKSIITRKVSENVKDSYYINTKSFINMNNKVETEGNTERVELQLKTTSKARILQRNYVKSKFMKKMKDNQALNLKIITKKLLCFCRRDNSTITLLYDIATTQLQEKLDIIYYLKFTNKFEKFCELFLDYEQRLCLNYLKQDVLSPQDIKIDGILRRQLTYSYEEKYNEKEIFDILLYFSKNKHLDDRNEKLLKMIDHNFDKVLKGFNT
jgi:hypothetical protein